MKFGWKIFSTIRLYKSPGTLRGPLRAPPDNFYKIFVRNFRFLELKLFGGFRVKMVKVWRNIFFATVPYNSGACLRTP